MILFLCKNCNQIKVYIAYRLTTQARVKRFEFHIKNLLRLPLAIWNDMFISYDPSLRKDRSLQNMTYLSQNVSSNFSLQFITNFVLEM